MPQRSFRELSPSEVLMLAINVEEANGVRLRTFAQMFADHSPEAAMVFAAMAAEEDRHRNQLAEFYRQRYGQLQSTIAEEDVPEVIEAHDLDDAEHQVFDSLSLRRALRTVLASEVRAQDFYRKALMSAEPDLHPLFQELAEFEAGHVRRIEACLETLGEQA